MLDYFERRTENGCLTSCSISFDDLLSQLEKIHNCALNDNI